MIRDLKDEEYFEISGKGNPKGVLDEIERLLLSIFIIEKTIAENCAYIQIVGKYNKVVQWRRRFRPSSNYLVPKYLLISLKKKKDK